MKFLVNCYKEGDDTGMSSGVVYKAEGTDPKDAIENFLENIIDDDFFQVEISNDNFEYSIVAYNIGEAWEVHTYDDGNDNHYIFVS